MGFARAPGLLALALAVALGCQGEEERLAGHLSRAEAYLGEEKPAEAIIEYKNALQLRPNLAEAHWGLARGYLATGEARKAYWELQETVRLDPDNVEARIRYGGFLLFGKQEESEQALAQADEVLAREPDEAQAHLLRGRALELLQRPEEARLAYEKAVELEPEKPGFLRVLATFHARRDERDAAGALLRRLTGVDPSFRSYADLAGFLARTGEDAEAEAAYREALERAEPEEQRVAYQLLASFYSTRERYDEAEQTLRSGLEATDDDLDVIYALARFYHARGDVAKANAMIEEATRARPDDTRPFLILSAYRARNDDLDGALAAAEAALEVDPKDEASRLRKAELLVDLGLRESSKERLAAGRAIVQAILAGDPASPGAHYVQAKIALAEQRYDEAAAALRRALDARPDWAQAHLLLGSTLFLQGDRPGARAEAARALELDAQLLDAHRLLVRINAALGEHELAIEAARKILKRAPTDITTRIQLAESLLQRRKPQEALGALEAVPQEERNAEVHFALGRLHLLLGDLESARSELGAALEGRPHHAAILEALLEVDRREGQLDASLERVAGAVAAEPEDARLRRLQGTALILAGEPDRGEAALRRAVELDPNDLVAHRTLAQYYVATGRLESAIETYREALEAQPDSAALHLTLGSLYELRGETDDALKHYEQAVGLDPTLAVAKNNLAYLLADRGANLDRALDLAQEAKELLPESPHVADTLGWVLFKKGIPQAAVGYLKEAEGAFPSEHSELGMVRHHLAQAYEANGEPERARETLERALAAREAAVQEAERAGDAAPPEPGWVAEARAMLERLSRAASEPPAEG